MRSRLLVAAPLLKAGFVGALGVALAVGVVAYVRLRLDEIDEIAAELGPATATS